MSWGSNGRKGDPIKAKKQRSYLSIKVGFLLFAYKFRLVQKEPVPL